MLWYGASPLSDVVGIPPQELPRPIAAVIVGAAAGSGPIVGATMRRTHRRIQIAPQQSAFPDRSGQMRQERGPADELLSRHRLTSVHRTPDQDKDARVMTGRATRQAHKIFAAILASAGPACADPSGATDDDSSPGCPVGQADGSHVALAGTDREVMLLPMHELGFQATRKATRKPEPA